ncbi:hypothetical protein JOF29_006241 [Kribbella aluminosa]|uniref:Uncharacterized protein n=1 Tax=Kribbella aluminosa TaxID=416017 RepID=A0ABS4UU16_9ACTN|nr:hypothetical protein [Kribbella aluminosa]
MRTEPPDDPVFASGPLAERSAANQRLIAKGLLGFR